MKKGFYKLQEQDITNLMYAPYWVRHKDYELKIDEKDNHTYPVEGWYYFETNEEAETFFLSQGWEKPEEE
jgi:hypothetical protein